MTPPHICLVESYPVELEVSCTVIQCNWAFSEPNQGSNKLTCRIDSTNLPLPVGSVTRWLNYFSIFGHLHQWNWAQKCHKFAKVGSAFCQIRNKPLKICQRHVNCCQSGEISPNLVTLPVGLVEKLPMTGIECRFLETTALPTMWQQPPKPNNAEIGWMDTLDVEDSTYTMLCKPPCSQILYPLLLDNFVPSALIR